MGGVPVTGCEDIQLTDRYTARHAPGTYLALQLSRVSWKRPYQRRLQKLHIRLGALATRVASIRRPSPSPGLGLDREILHAKHCSTARCQLTGADPGRVGV